MNMIPNETRYTSKKARLFITAFRLRANIHESKILGIATAVRTSKPIPKVSGTVKITPPGSLYDVAHAWKTTSKTPYKNGMMRLRSAFWSLSSRSLVKYERVRLFVFSMFLAKVVDLESCFKSTLVPSPCLKNASKSFCSCALGETRLLSLVMRYSFFFSSSIRIYPKSAQ